LSWLIGERHFIVLCTILYNRFRINLHALTNTRANGFAFINTIYAINIAKFLNIKATQLEEPIVVKGFNSKCEHTTTYILTLHLSINRHCFTNIPFLILDLGNHNLILRLK
jgi:hypothetical protein